MKLLVTGGAGYIGGIVAARLVAQGHQVVVLDDLSTGHADTVQRIGAHADEGGSVALVRASLHDVGEVLDDTFEGVLHFAARTQVGESVAQPERYWHTNVGGSLVLLEAMRVTGVRRLVCSSTAATYGEPADTPITEATPTAPVNPYGASKLAVDHAIGGYASAHGFAATSLRYFNVVGALRGVGGSPPLCERHDPESHLVPNLLRAARDGTPVSVFGTDYPTRDGTTVRDYLDVRDLADAHLAALDAQQPGRHAVYNLGTSAGSTVREVLAAVEAVVDRRLQVTEEPRRPGDPPSLVASSELAAAELGWRPRRSLHQAIADAWTAMREG